MHKIQRKYILIGIISVLVVALVAVFTIPALANGSPPWGPRGGGNNNMTVVQGTIADLSSTSITISETGGSSVPLTLNSSTNFNIQGTDWIGYTSTSTPLVGDSVTAMYKNGQSGTPIASQVMINMPKPPANKNFANIQGNLTVTGGTINITFTPPSQTLTAPSTVTVLYNTTSNVIQGLMLNRSGQPTGTPKTPPSKNFSTVQGNVTIASGSITIVTTATGLATSPASGETVTILYNSSTGAVQGIMLPRSGQPFNMPMGRPNQNGGNKFGHGL